jgi:hypothetical protein
MQSLADFNGLHVVDQSQRVGMVGDTSQARSVSEGAPGSGSSLAEDSHLGWHRKRLRHAAWSDALTNHRMDKPTAAPAVSGGAPGPRFVPANASHLGWHRKRLRHAAWSDALTNHRMDKPTVAPVFKLPGTQQVFVRKRAGRDVCRTPARGLDTDRNGLTSAFLIHRDTIGHPLAPNGPLPREILRGRPSATTHLFQKNFLHRSRGARLCGYYG